jgi:hypothetical protein
MLEPWLELVLICDYKILNFLISNQTKSKPLLAVDQRLLKRRNPLPAKTCGDILLLAVRITDSDQAVLKKPEAATGHSPVRCQHRQTARMK